MKIYDMTEEKVSTGKSFFVYGPPGIGKTHAIGTLQEPVQVFSTEPRDPREVLRFFGKKQITFVEGDTVKEYLEALHQLYQEIEQGNPRGIKSVAFDSLSYFMVRAGGEFEDSRFEDAILEEKRRNTLIDQFRLEIADWGGMASLMLRVTAALQRLSKLGIIVYATATLTENPRWDRSLQAAPSFEGKKFSANFNAFFDYIGVLVPGGSKIYPPTVKFCQLEVDDSFIAKCCSAKLLATIMEKGSHPPLDFNVLLKVIG